MTRDESFARYQMTRKATWRVPGLLGLPSLAAAASVRHARHRWHTGRLVIGLGGNADGLWLGAATASECGDEQQLSRPQHLKCHGGARKKCFSSQGCLVQVGNGIELVASSNPTGGALVV